MPSPKGRPNKLKIMSGEKRPCRLNKNEPEVAYGFAEPPAWLSETAAQHFRRISATLDRMQIASPDDADNLAMLASRLEEIEICTAVIEDSGRTYQTTTQGGDLMHRARPEVAMRNEAMRHAQSLLSEFGLSPAARSKVSASSQSSDNPFAAIDGGKIG